ncbi:DUF6571 family protein [Streptomyces sp. NPDC101151]|uniref:DUF6571 family protein n=1 Tax=Streptomyces sp. NPDC101151 TaxID=3366115 RepID=UPI00380C2F6F
MDLNVLLHGNFAQLGSAISDWESMTKKLETLERDARDNLKTKAVKARWEGINATVSREFVSKTADEFTDAHTQAQSVTNILRDTREELIDYRTHLEEAIERGRKKNLTVVDDGCGMFHVQMIVHPDRAAKGTTVPDHDELDAELLRDEVKRILTKATESDSSAAKVLKSLVDSVKAGFADSDYRDRDEAVDADSKAVQDKKNAKEAADLYARLDGLSDDEMNRLAKLTEQGKNSPVFAGELMKDLNFRGRDGQEALLLLAGNLEGGGRDGQVSSAERRLRDALSANLATATRPDAPLGPSGGVPSDWTEKLLKTAREGNGLPAQHPGALEGEATGLGTLTKLMGAGDAVYDGNLLSATGDEIRDYETHTKDPYPGIGDNWKGTQEDPMGGLMKAMSRNPEAAESYFDPHKNDNLDYFLKGRHWPGSNVESEMPDDLVKTSARASFGDALEAAATGRQPGTPLHAQIPVHHSAAQADIFEKSVNYYGEQSKGQQDALPAALRHPMGDMIGDYASDVHDILGKDLNGSSQFNHLDIQREALTRVMRGAAEDPKAFQTMHQSQSAVIAEGLRHFGKGSFEHSDPALHAWVKQSSSVLGYMDGIRGDVIYDMGQAQKDTNSWNKMMNYHVIGAPITGIPIVGDTMQRLVDVGTAEYMNDLNAQVDKETREHMADHFSNGRRQMDAMLEQQALDMGMKREDLDRSPGEYEDNLQSIEESWYNHGIKGADQAMGERY